MAVVLYKVKCEIVYHAYKYCVSDMNFFFNDTATTEIYTLSLHDALPIWRPCVAAPSQAPLTPQQVSYWQIQN